LIKITDGIISSKTGFDGDITTYQISAPIQRGNSGGPLFDEKGNLISINSSGIRIDVAANVGYTIKTNYIFSLLDVLPKKIDLDLLGLTSPNLYNENLNFLFKYFNTDKGEFFVDQYMQPIKKNNKKIPAHGYSKFYEKFFKVRLILRKCIRKSFFLL